MHYRVLKRKGIITTEKSEYCTQEYMLIRNWNEHGGHR